MLLKLKVKNFLSFYEESAFDMFPNLKRTTFPQHIYSNLEIPLLKLAAIYGANGSGKSNLLNAIKFLKSFATEKNFLNKNNIILNKFRLAGDKNDDPICISLEFYHQSIYFLYNVEINTDRIQKEELWISGIGKKEDEPIYSRVNREFKAAKPSTGEVQKAIDKLLESNPLSSMLALNNEFPILEDLRVKHSFSWFLQQINTLTLRRVNPSLINNMSENQDFIQFVNKLISQIGLGIEKIGIEEKKLSEIMSDPSEEFQQINEKLVNRLKNGNILHMQNDRILFTIEDQDGEQIIKRLVFNQIGLNGYFGDMEYEAQSDGTARILNLIPALYDIKNRDCVYCIDEIENSIHPSLMMAIMKFYSEMPTKGQLIFTTHETELLNQQALMRPDEVWFTEKQYGNTHLYSLNDFKEHNTINIKNGYLDGRYGAIPFIGNLGE